MYNATKGINKRFWQRIQSCTSLLGNKYCLCFHSCGSCRSQLWTVSTTENKNIKPAKFWALRKPSTFVKKASLWQLVSPIVVGPVLVPIFFWQLPIRISTACNHNTQLLHEAIALIELHLSLKFVIRKFFDWGNYPYLRNVFLLVTNEFGTESSDTQWIRWQQPIFGCIWNKEDAGTAKRQKRETDGWVGFNNTLLCSSTKAQVHSDSREVSCEASLSSWASSSRFVELHLQVHRLHFWNRHESLLHTV